MRLGDAVSEHYLTLIQNHLDMFVAQNDCEDTAIDELAYNLSSCRLTHATRPLPLFTISVQYRLIRAIRPHCIIFHQYLSPICLKALPLYLPLLRYSLALTARVKFLVQSPS